MYNQYKDQGIRTYIPMPYFLSSGGYGVWLDTDRYTEFDMCSGGRTYGGAVLVLLCRNAKRDDQPVHRGFRKTGDAAGVGVRTLDVQQQLGQ